MFDTAHQNYTNTFNLWHDKICEYVPPGIGGLNVYIFLHISKRLRFIKNLKYIYFKIQWEIKKTQNNRSGVCVFKKQMTSITVTRQLQLYCQLKHCFLSVKEEGGKALPRIILAFD